MSLARRSKALSKGQGIGFNINYNFYLEVPRSHLVSPVSTAAGALDVAVRVEPVWL